MARTGISVLISGESGTGKGVIAGLIHATSDRSAGQFVAINCAAIPERMLEAVLFGHEKGALAGAHRRIAGGGTSGRGANRTQGNGRDRQPTGRFAIFVYSEEQARGHAVTARDSRPGG